MRKVIIICILSMFILCACSKGDNKETNNKETEGKKLTLEMIKNDNNLLCGDWIMIENAKYSSNMQIKSDGINYAIYVKCVYGDDGTNWVFDLKGSYNKNDEIYVEGTHTATFYYENGSHYTNKNDCHGTITINGDGTLVLDGNRYKKEGYEAEAVKKPTEQTTEKEETKFSDEYILSVGRQYISRAINDSAYSQYYWEYVKDVSVTKTAFGYTATYYVYCEERHTYKYVRVNMGVSGDSLYYANGGM